MRGALVLGLATLAAGLGLRLWQWGWRLFAESLRDA